MQTPKPQVLPISKSLLFEFPSAPDPLGVLLWQRVIFHFHSLSQFKGYFLSHLGLCHKGCTILTVDRDLPQPRIRK